MIFNDRYNIRNLYIGSDDYSEGFFCFDGTKQYRSYGTYYGTLCSVGDTIDLILDLATTYGTVEYIKNGLSLGTAFIVVK